MSKKESSIVNHFEEGIIICTVKNCNTKIEAGKEVILEGKPYCTVCGTILMKQIFGL